LVRVPIGTDRDPPVQRILDLESKWKPALERGPGSVLIHTFTNMSGDPAAFDRRNEWKIFLIISVLVLDCDLHDVVDGWLGLGMKGFELPQRRARHCRPLLVRL
jgi:hypothetical protein